MRRSERREESLEEAEEEEWSCELLGRTTGCI